MQFVLESDRMLCQSHVTHNQLRKLNSRIENELLRALLHFKYQWMDENLDFYLQKSAEDRGRINQTQTPPTQKFRKTHPPTTQSTLFFHMYISKPYPQLCCIHTWSCMPRHVAEVLSRFSQLVFQTKFSHEGSVLKLDTAYLVTCY